MHAFLADLGHTWLHGTLNDLRRYVVFAVSVWFVLWVALAAVLRGRKVREATPDRRQLEAEFLFSVRSIMIFSAMGLLESLADRAGFYPLNKVSESWGPVWFWASLIIMIVAHDAYIYWTHRIMHDPRLFRRFHRRHHKSNNPSPFTAYSFDVGEALVMVLFVEVWPMLVPTSWGVVGIFMLHQIFRNTMLHCGYELMPMRKNGKPWLDFLTTTTHHDLHHAQAGYNYAAWFTWWDRWMGTEHPDYHARYAETARRPYVTLPKPISVA